MKAKIAVLPGDGIGPEIMRTAQDVLSAVGAKFSHAFHFETALIGGAAIDQAGVPLPEETLSVCRQSDAVLLGAVGGQKWDAIDPSIRPEKGLLALRKGLSLYANLRPVQVEASLRHASPLKDRLLADGIDLLIVRELLGGMYFGERRTDAKDGVRFASDMEYYDETTIARIAETAFRAAADRKKTVTLVDKANVLDSSKLWRTVTREVHENHPDVELETLYVDNCAMQLIRDPAHFDVILTNNLFGDILSDEASVIPGSIGLLPSASLGLEDLHLYEPIHGSAPDIAGKDLANPCGMIRSAAMMLRHSFGLEKEAAAIETAVSSVLKRGILPADLAEDKSEAVGTRRFGEAVCAAL